MRCNVDVQARSDDRRLSEGGLLGRDFGSLLALNADKLLAFDHCNLNMGRKSADISRYALGFRPGPQAIVSSAYS